MASWALDAWRQLVHLALLPHLLLLLDAAGARPCFWPGQAPEDPGCLSWRVMVEANNARGWRTVPAQCVGYVKGYMTRGQYLRDLAGVMEQASGYADQIAAGAGADPDGLDAWVFDIDDTCLSNLPYYEIKQFGCARPQLPPLSVLASRHRSDDDGSEEMSPFQGVRSVGLQGVGEQGGMPGDTPGARAVHGAAGQGLQGLPPLRAGRGDAGPLHGREPGSRGLLRVREAHHEVRARRSHCPSVVRL